MAQEKHRLNLHIPKPLFEVLEVVRAKHGMSYTEFANRAIDAAVDAYSKTGALPLHG